MVQPQNAVTMLIGCKSDLAADRQVAIKDVCQSVCLCVVFCFAVLCCVDVSLIASAERLMFACVCVITRFVVNS